MTLYSLKNERILRGMIRKRFRAFITSTGVWPLTKHRITILGQDGEYSRYDVDSGGDFTLMIVEPNETVCPFMRKWGMACVRYDCKTCYPKDTPCSEGKSREQIRNEVALYLDDVYDKKLTIHDALMKIMGLIPDCKPKEVSCRTPWRCECGKETALFGDCECHAGGLLKDGTHLECQKCCETAEDSCKCHVKEEKSCECFCDQMNGGQCIPCSLKKYDQNLREEIEAYNKRIDQRLRDVEEKVGAKIVRPLESKNDVWETKDVQESDGSTSWPCVTFHYQFGEEKKDRKKPKSKKKKK